MIVSIFFALSGMVAGVETYGAGCSTRADLAEWARPDGTDMASGKAPAMIKDA